MGSTIETILELRDNVSKKLDGVSKSINRFSNKTIRMGKNIRQSGQEMEYLGRDILALNAPFLAVGGAAIKTGMQFDRSMSQVKAISGATGKEFDVLKNKAMEVGATTSKSASDAANGMIFLAQAGYKNNEILRLSKPLVQLAIAGNMDMAKASSLLADSMHSANLSINDSQKYLDNVAKTANISNTSVSELMEAWTEAGGSLRTANITMSETSALLGILANAGIKGSEAGTSLSRIFMNMNSTGAEAGKMMKSLGIATADSSGKMRSKIDVLRELKEKTDKMSEAERNAAIQAIGGKQYANDLKIILDGLGGDFDKLTKQIDGSSGALNKMAKTMADNVGGDFDDFKSKTEAALIKVSNAIAPTVRQFLQAGSKIMEKLSEADPKLINLVAKIVMVGTSIGLANVGIGKFRKTIGGVIVNTGRVIHTFNKLASGTTLLNKMIKGSATSFKLFGRVGKLLGKTFLKLGKTLGVFVVKSASKLIALLAGIGPVGWIVIAVIAAIAVVGVLIYKNWDKVKALFGKLKDKVLEFIRAILKIKLVKDILNIVHQGVIGFVDGFKQAFEGLKNFFGGFFKFLQGVFTGDGQMVFEGLKQMFHGAVQFITGIWKGLGSFLAIPLRAMVKLLSTAFHAAINKVKQAWNATKRLLGKVIKGTVNAVTSAFHTAINKVKEAWNNLKNFMSHPIQGLVNMVRGGDVDGQHRSGRGRIPFDGYRAELHKDEMVLNKHDADEYRKNRVQGRQNGKTTQRIVNINSLADKLVVREESDVDKIAEKLARKLRLA